MASVLENVSKNLETAASIFDIRNSKWLVTWVSPGATVSYNIKWAFDNSFGLVDEAGWKDGKWDFSGSREDQINITIPSMGKRYVMIFTEDRSKACVTENGEYVHLCKRVF